MENKIRLNNFILWCKGWYVCITEDNIYTQMQKILTLDDYLPKNNPVSIVLYYLDELIEKQLIPPIKLHVWQTEMAKYVCLYGIDYNTALLTLIKYYFAFEFDTKLNPPTYSRKLYKLGFVAPKHFGNSYKLANYKANKFFGNHYER